MWMSRPPWAWGGGEGGGVGGGVGVRAGAGGGRVAVAVAAGVRCAGVVTEAGVVALSACSGSRLGVVGSAAVAGVEGGVQVWVGGRAEVGRGHTALFRSTRI